MKLQWLYLTELYICVCVCINKHKIIIVKVDWKNNIPYTFNKCWLPPGERGMRGLRHGIRERYGNRRVMWFCFLKKVWDTNMTRYEYTLILSGRNIIFKIMFVTFYFQHTLWNFSKTWKSWKNLLLNAHISTT